MIKDERVKSLVYLLSRTMQVSSLEIFHDVSKDSKLFRAYELIEKNLDTDQDIMPLIYPDYNSVAYEKLLNRLENKIFDYILWTSNYEIKNNAFAVSIDTYKKFISIKILESIGRNDLMIEYGDRLLKKAQGLNLHDLILILTERLEYHYSFVHIDINKASHYTSIYTSSLKVLLNRNKASKLYYALTKRVTNEKGGGSSEENELLLSQVKELKVMIHADCDKNLAQRIFSSLYFAQLLSKEYQQMVETCDWALGFYNEYYPKNIVQRFMFTLRKGVAFLYSGNFDAARVNLDVCIAINPTPGMLHWNSLYSYCFTFEMLTENYQNATDILVDIVTTPSLSRLDEIWIQQWRIRSAYIHFLSKIGEVDLERVGKKRVPNFRLGKFLNEVPIYSKDKRGLNISILIAQMLILLADRKKELLYDRIEALNKYSYRHLKNDNRLRSNCFIRMILALVKADFNPIRANRYAEKYIAKLNTTEMNLNEYSADIEIIPYERLWHIILDLCTPNKKAVSN